MRGRNGWLTQGEGEGERVTDSNEAATSSQGGRGTCGLSVRYCGTRCGTEPSSSYCRFPVINVPRRASNPCTARSSPPLPLSLSLSLGCSAAGVADLGVMTYRVSSARRSQTPFLQPPPPSSFTYLAAKFFLLYFAAHPRVSVCASQTGLGMYFLFF